MAVNLRGCSLAPGSSTPDHRAGHRRPNRELLVRRRTKRWSSH